MSFYSIKDLEQLSGIKAHTLRIWEQRYNFLKPKRTDTNIRFYDDSDLKLILNVALLKDNGFKISRIATMSEKEMGEEILHLTQKSLKYEEQIHAITLSMIEMDEAKFDKIISTNLLKIGFEATMINILYPFLSKLGVLWQTGSINPAQEHFISNLIRQKIVVAIDGQDAPPIDAPRFILYLPETELHEISLLFSAYLLKSRGMRVVYLGQSLPFHDLVSAHKVYQPQYMLTFLTTYPGSANVQEYIYRLSNTFPDTDLVLSGYQVIAQDLDLPSNVHLFTNMNQLVELIEQAKGLNDTAHRGNGMSHSR
ncbi:MerR family transcriptional regulator [Cytophagales bacterium LB-30]|uniref:MerR family transcriptional regulator n=1 Tax=Shiella aurantiaca TaxID=3058365 RepID=A0ABT8F565_9BACT|nr:MerR family transcriptional regulator [Shiella aurantiaca]MDN4165518.1 MerR family transcriptional regulator [Shiella aurantiaca]